MRTTILQAILALLFLSGPWAMGQTSEDLARIDYEAAKIALKHGDGQAALVKLEKVLAVLGEQPELLALAATAAETSGDLAKAKSFGMKALAKADSAFRQSDSYGQLVSLLAEVDLKLGAAPDTSQWDASWGPQAVPGFAPRHYSGGLMHESSDQKSSDPFETSCSASATTRSNAVTGKVNGLVKIDCTFSTARGRTFEVKSSSIECAIDFVPNQRTGYSDCRNSRTTYWFRNETRNSLIFLDAWSIENRGETLEVVLKEEAGSTIGPSEGNFVRVFWKGLDAKLSLRRSR